MNLTIFALSQEIRAAKIPVFREKSLLLFFSAKKAMFRKNLLK